MTPEKITEWLQRPTIHLEPAEVEQLVAEHPYFVPARYMQAALQHNERSYASKALANMRLYMGNWVLFHELLETAAGRKPLKPTNVPDIPIVEMPAIENPVQTEVLPESPVLTDDIAVKDDGAEVLDEVQPMITQPVNSQTNQVVNKEEQMSEQTLAEVDIETQKEKIGEKREVMNDDLIEPAFTEDYFRHQGIVIDDELPETPANLREHTTVNEAEGTPEKQDPRSLMVVMSFTEWLLHFRTKSQKEKEEEEDRKAMKSMWQKEKLAAALEEEDDEIPEEVFEMAVHSLDKDEGLVSESLAEILTKQGKTQKAIDMYRKLSLRNPQKSAYFAQQISTLQKNTDL